MFCFGLEDDKEGNNNNNGEEGMGVGGHEEKVTMITRMMRMLMRRMRVMWKTMREDMEGVTRMKETTVKKVTMVKVRKSLSEYTKINRIRK